jgi:2,3-dihydroxy-p-cumate/2,3-dihydroxybenzoate 3,4-dioxygenase
MIRYKKLGYVAINVSDLERSVPFYRDVVGLEQVGEITNNMAFLTCSTDYYNIILCKSDQEPGLKRIAFELETPEMLERAFEILSAAGMNPYEVSAEERACLKTGKSIRFRDQNGILFEFYSSILQRPVEFQPKPIKLAKLDHVVLRVPNLEDSLKFFLDTLNFKVSDYRHKPTGEMTFAFMRCFPNPFHHSFGLQASNELKLFHVAFKVKNIDDIGMGRNRFINYNVPIVFGPGRHLASGSIFMYFLDPDGITLEYTLGMEEFPEVNPREPRMLDNTMKTTDLWEGAVDPRIGKVGHVEVE